MNTKPLLPLFVTVIGSVLPIFAKDASDCNRPLQCAVRPSGTTDHADNAERELRPGQAVAQSAPAHAGGGGGPSSFFIRPDGIGPRFR